MASWIEDILSAFDRIGGGGTYSRIYDAVAAVRGADQLPPQWQAVVRRKIQDCSSQSEGFKGKADLFEAPHGKGAGYWALKRK